MFGQDCDMLYFSDDPTLLKDATKKGWTPMYILSDHGDARLLQRTVKTQAHRFLPEQYEISIYLDGNLKPKPSFSLTHLRSHFGLDTADMVCWKHWKRTTIEQEAKEVVRLKLETQEHVDQVRQRQTGYKDNMGLTETNILIRRHNKICKFGDEWKECIEICRRDQISFDFLLHKHNVKTWKHAYCTKPVIMWRHDGQLNSSKRCVTKILSPNNKNMNNTSNNSTSVLPPIVFVVRPNFGSSQMRGIQVCKCLQTLGIQCTVMTADEVSLQVNDRAILVWVKFIDRSIILKMKHCIHIHDIVDSWTSGRISITQCDAYIVNNNKMATHLEGKQTFVIPHHWDERLEHIPHQNDKLSFGYMGCLASLKHSTNLCHVRQLVSQDLYPIQFVDTELCGDVTDKVRRSIPIPPKETKKLHHTFETLPIHFNCHLSVREPGVLFDFKTSAKVATAASMDHNIITTKELSAMHVLPEDYPFLLADSKWETLQQMLQTVHDDFYGSQVLWRQGLDIMKQVKNKTSLPHLCKQYIDMFHTLIC